MASYKMEFDDGIITKTLNFMGKNFTEEWKEGGTFCPCAIEYHIEQTFPNLPDYVFSLIEDLTQMKEDELLDALTKLTDYEQKVFWENR